MEIILIKFLVFATSEYLIEPFVYKNTLNIGKT